MSRSTHGLESEPARPHAWRKLANCQGEDILLFFGPEGERASDRVIREDLAKQVCDGCPVRRECLEEAFQEAIQHGVWAGLGVEERKAERVRWLRRRQREAAA